MANPICYGDIVFVDLDDCLLFSSGFFEPNLHVVSKSNICLKAFRYGLFKIYPNFSYKDITQVDELKDQLDLLKSLNPEADRSYNELNKDLTEEQKALEDRDAKLDLLNEKIFNESKGLPIKYGQKIQLFHLQSQSFIVPLKTPNESDKAMLQLSLIKQGNKNVYFKFKPLLGFIREGEVVEYNTPLQIICIKTETPIIRGFELDLNTIKTQINDSSNVLTNNPHDFPVIWPRRKEPLFQQEKVFHTGLKSVEVPDSTYIRKYLQFQEQEEMKKKKILTNGDYIRISNDKVYLTAYPGNPDLICFQSYGAHQDYVYNNIYTLFQIVEIPEDAGIKKEDMKESVQKFNSSFLPRGSLLEYNESKRYFLKHVVTGKMLICDKGGLKLESRNDATADLEKVSIVIKNKSKDNVKEKYIDRNAIMQVKFYGSKGETYGILSIGKGIKIPNVNQNFSTEWFFGFEMTEDYLNRSLRTERFTPRIKPTAEEKSSSLKFAKISSEENTNIFLGESLANQFAKFLDFLNNFLKDQSSTLVSFNSEVRKLADVCSKFEKQMYDEDYNEEDQESLTPNKLIQNLLREFRIYDMMYRIFFYLIREGLVLTQIAKIIEKEQTEVLSPEVRTLGRSITLTEELKNKKNVNFDNLLDLFKIIKKIVFVSFKKNSLNRMYCSQFVRIPINCVLNSDNGVFSIANFKTKMQMKEIMLALCKKGLWDEDLDAIGQLNRFQNPIFQQIRKQETFHTIYLNLVEHMSRSKAPNLDNKLRNNFLAEFLRDESNIKHTFPSLVEEDETIYVMFNRIEFPENSYKVDIEELDETLVNEEIKDDEEKDKIRMATTYLISSLDLMSALVLSNTSTWNLMIVKYYRYETLAKAINKIKNSPKHREIRLSMGEILNSVHQRFFSIPFVKLPMKLQIVNEDPNMNNVLEEIDTFIKNAVDTSLSTSEINYLKSQGIEDIIHPLKTIITSESDVQEVTEFITSGISMDKPEKARVALEEIQKVLENTIDINLKFLQISQKLVVELVRGAVNQKKKIHFDFISQALNVFTLIEKKMITFSATDIIGSLQYQAPAERKLIQERSIRLSTKEEGDKGEVIDLESNAMMQKPSINKKLLEGKSRESDESPEWNVFTGAISALSEGWKSGKKLVSFTTLGFGRKGSEQDLFSQFDTTEIINTLLDISLLNDQQLISGVIEQLRRIASYEGVLFSELNKFTIIHESQTLNKVADLIRSSFRLNEISREVFFCSDIRMELKESTVEEMQTEVITHLWEIFFTIYDPEKHFRYKDSSLTADERFKQAFQSSKSVENDKSFNLNENAINRQFQKIFSILKVYKSLLKTLQWMMDPRYHSDQSRHATRLILIILCAFLNENRENQELFSNMNDFIHLYYLPKYIEQSPDTLLVFREMMRENKRLLKLSVKYLYDITLNTFVGTLPKKIEDKNKDSYLAATINSYDFLVKCLIPEEVFSPIDDLRDNWEQISYVDEFPSLNVLTYPDDVIEVPHCYQSIYQNVEATIKTLEHFVDNTKKISEMQVFLPFEKWMGFFESKNYLLQFELKNQITKCLSKMYFEFGKKGKLLHKFDECSVLFISVIYDIFFYRNYTTTKEKQENYKLSQLAKNRNFITLHPQFVKLRNLYAIAEGVDLENKKLNLGFEQISLFALLNEYVYGGCLDLLFHLALNEIDHFTEIVDKRADMKTMMDILLILLDDLIVSEGSKENFPKQKIEKFLNSVSVIRGYGCHKDKIMALSNKLARQKKGQMGRMILHQIQDKEDSPLESFHKQLESLRQSKRALKEKNIKQVADSIASHKDADEILKQIINYLKKDLSKMDIEEVKFLLRVLRKYIEREHVCAAGDDTVDKWKDVTITELKKVGKIQNVYKEQGLTEILYNFLSATDPKVFNETLLLSLAYLYGGNSDVQEEFFNMFTEDDENLVMELLSGILKDNWEIFRAKETERIHNLYGLIQKGLFEYLKENESIENLTEEQLEKLSIEFGIDNRFKESADASSMNKEFMLILSFLQSLCEKQYTNMQKFLRDQTWKGRVYPQSFDFLGFLRQCINGYHKVMCKYNLSVGNKLLALITELIQGDVTDNISVFLNKTFIYDMCRIVTDYNTRYHTLPRGFGLNAFNEDFREIKSQVIFIFKTMLENRNENNIRVLTEHLDVAGLMKAFEQFMQNFLGKKGLHDRVPDVDRFIFSLSNDDFKDTLGDAINIYIIYRYIWDDPTVFSDKMRELIGQMDKNVQDLLGRIIFPLFKKLVTSIEIVVETKSESLIRVWFPIIAVCNYLSGDTMNNFLNNVERDNIQTKISSLTDATQEFVPQMYAEYSARESLIGFNLKNLYDGFRITTNLLSIIIACVNIGSFQVTENEPVQSIEAYYAVTVMNCIQIFIAFSLIIMWYLFFRNRHLSLRWERYVEENVKSLGPLPPTVKNKLEDGNYNELDENDCRLIMILEGANSEEFQEMKEYAPSFQKIARSYYLKNILFTINSKKLIWHKIYFGITIGALFHPLIASFEIFDIAIRSDTIKQLYLAVSKNTRQFAWTLFLLVATNVIYSLISFFFLNETFVSGDDVLCETAFSCFMNTLNLGLRSGGGIADAIGPQPYISDNRSLFILRVLFDLSFFIIMIILLLNLIFGMIIDAFGELRDQKSANEEDQNNVCFICGVTRSEFERHTSFEDHLSDEHNIWSYVYYIIYLLDRQKTSKVDMTDIENLVLEKYQQKDFDWFPIGKSLTLEKISKQEKVSNENEIAKLAKKIDTIQKNTADSESKLNAKIEQILSLLKK